MKKLAILTLALVLSACSYPKSAINQGVVDARLYVTTDFLTGRVYVDGVDRGDVTAFDGKKDHFIQVSPGKHLVEIRNEGGVVYKKYLYAHENSTSAIKAGE
jgi:hypothetical protein